MEELDCVLRLNLGEVGALNVDNFKVNSSGNSVFDLNARRVGCVLAPLSVFPLCVFFVVAAVLQGLHFSFGSRPNPILFQVVILGQSAMPVLSYLDNLQTKFGKKKNTQNVWITFFLIKGHASATVFLLSF